MFLSSVNSHIKCYENVKEDLRKEETATLQQQEVQSCHSHKNNFDYGHASYTITNI